jgi:hypothetical protein
LSTLKLAAVRLSSFGFRADKIGARCDGIGFVCDVHGFGTSRAWLFRRGARGAQARRSANQYGLWPPLNIDPDRMTMEALLWAFLGGRVASYFA